MTTFTILLVMLHFFPQLVAGPIVRAQHFHEQIKGEIRTNPYKFRLGLTLIFYGLMKKIPYCR